jgi:uncharacterized protein (DUF433 family)
MATLFIDHIVSSPDMHWGKPYIANKGIKVEFIAELYNFGWTVEDLVEEFELTPGQVHAALSYYFDHKEEIDRSIRESEEKTRDIGTPIEELRKRIEARKGNR